MKKIKDIKTNLNKSIDISKIWKLRKIEVFPLKNNILYDIRKIFKKTINISSYKYIKIFKNNTKNFDGVIQNKKLRKNNYLDPFLITEEKKKFFKENQTIFDKKSSFFPKNKAKSQNNKKYITSNIFDEKNLQNNTKKSYFWYKITTSQKDYHSNKGLLPFVHKKRFSIFWYKYFKSKKLKYLSIFLILIISLYLINWYIIKYLVYSWYTNLIYIKNNSSDIKNIQKKLKKSKYQFLISSVLFKPFLIIPNQNIKNLYFAIKWWQDVVLLLDNLLSYYNNLLSEIEKQWIENIFLTNFLRDYKWSFYDIANILSNIIHNYEKIWDIKLQKNNIQNIELEKKFIQSKKILKLSYNLIVTLKRNFEIFLDILWSGEERKYLILFQNNDEIRPTWWFIWSLWIVSVYGGKIKNIELDDIYSYEWDINKVYKNKILAPKWLNKITKTLSLRDANYKIDFSDSSKEIKFFTDKINKKIDWIIYVNQSIILDLLKVTGDIYIDFESNQKIFKERIWEDNFSSVISTLVEAKTFKVWTLWTPKKILFDFSKIFLQKLKEQKKYLSYIEVILDNIISRDIVITSFHPKENSLLWKLWLRWDISFLKTLDYAYPVFTSIWWWKTDRYYKRQYKKIVNINEDCSIDTTLEIKWSHLFSKKQEDIIIDLMDRYNIRDKNILFIQWKANNKSYVRVLLPKDAIIKKNKDITISEYKNHKLVEFYTETRRFNTSSNTIEYSIKNESCDDYNFALYKQAWIKNYDIEVIKNWVSSKGNWIWEDYLYNH